MVQVVILSANGEHRTLKTAAFTAGSATGAAVAKAVRKTTPATVISTYNYKDQVITVWGWLSGKAGTENKHELPPDEDGSEAPLLFGDAIAVSSTGDFTDDQYSAFYEDAFGGFENVDSSDDEEEEEEEEDEEDEEEAEEEEKEEDDGEDGDADEDDEGEEEADAEEAEGEEEAEEAEEDADDDCYDDGDENGGNGKRRAPRRRAIASPEYRRIDMGLRARVKLPAPLGKRAPKWQTAPELEEEAYTTPA
jgi:hypothetical protein